MAPALENLDPNVGMVSSSMLPAEKATISCAATEAGGGEKEEICSQQQQPGHGEKSSSSCGSSSESDEPETETTTTTTTTTSSTRNAVAKFRIEKTFVEVNGSVFYEVTIDNLRARARELATAKGIFDEEDEEDESRGALDRAGWGRLTGAQALPTGSITVVRRYKHFRLFHRRLTAAANKAKAEAGRRWSSSSSSNSNNNNNNNNNDGSNGDNHRNSNGSLRKDDLGRTLSSLPRIPPRQLQLVVDHSSTTFVTVRARALERYMEELLSSDALSRLILGDPELLAWISDCPRPFYANSSKRDCPFVYRKFSILSWEDIPSWACHPRQDSPGGRQASGDWQVDRDDSDGEWGMDLTDRGSGLVLPMRELGTPALPSSRVSPTGGEGGGERGGNVAVAECTASVPRPTKLLGCGIASKLSVWRGNMWQLRVDALCVDAPGDYNPVPGTVFADIVRVAGVAAMPQLKVLDECRIGDVIALPCLHGLNLPARYLMFTGSAYYLSEHESASYSGLHLSYLKLLESAVVDYGMRTVRTSCTAV